MVQAWPAASRVVSLLIGTIAALSLMLSSAGRALAITAPVHIANTSGEGVLIHPEPNTSHPGVGWIPEGASPDYNCFVYGQVIGSVPIWFSVNFNGVSGYYASYYDDSSYHSDAELTSKYGVPKCGGQPSQGQLVPATDGSPTSAFVYFSPFNELDNPAWSHAADTSVATIYEHAWYENPPTASSCAQSAASGHAHDEANALAASASTLAGWSLGRLGPILYLKRATTAERGRITYVILIDPGSYDELTCDRAQSAGSVLASWLRDNAQAHLVVISSSAVSQLDHSRGIQETYFNAIRSLKSKNVNLRVITCNYKFDHYHAFFASQYWIAHRIGTTTSCPTLRDSRGTYPATASWHPNGG